MNGFQISGLEDKAQKYSRFKYSISLFNIVYSLAVLLIFLFSGAGAYLENILMGIFPSRLFLVPAYLLVLSLFLGVVNLPINFCGSYLLERRFGLSNQTPQAWFVDQLKSGALSYLLTLIILSLFYQVFINFLDWWWLIISFFWILFGLILTRVAPVLLVPLFFKYKKLPEGELRSRIIRLADKMKISLLDVFEIDFSKKTLKANAALVGMGKTRRVILADTLNNKYSDDEIEVILAHEFAHHKLGHLLKMILTNGLVCALLFYLIFRTQQAVLNIFNIASLYDLSGIVLLLVYFSIFGLITQPLENYISRRMETSADILALNFTGAAAFISMMEKLCQQNLADRHPGTLVKLFFFDHPSVDERIKLAKNFL